MWPTCSNARPEEAARVRRLLGAWNRVQSVPKLNAQALADIVYVILETRPDFDGSSRNLPPLDPGGREACISPYSGESTFPPRQTGSSPETPPYPAPYDLRPYLMEPGALKVGTAPLGAVLG